MGQSFVLAGSNASALYLILEARARGSRTGISSFFSQDSEKEHNSAQHQVPAEGSQTPVQQSNK